MLEITKYVSAGFISLFAHLLILYLLVENFLMDEVLSSSIGFFGAIFLNYSLQYYWTFRSSSYHRTAFFKYFLFSLFGLFLNSIIFFLILNLSNLNYVVAQFFTTIIIFTLNYGVNKKYVF